MTEKTIELAYSLGIPEGVIRKWAATRGELLVERDRRLSTTLRKLEHSLMAQILMHLTSSIVYTQEHNEEQN